MKKSNQIGSVSLIIALVLLAIAVAGTGWFVYRMNSMRAENNGQDKSNSSSQQSNKDQVGGNKFSCGSLSLSVPDDWDAVSAKDSEHSVVSWAACAISNKPIGELPGDLRALGSSEVLISINVDSIGQDLASYVDGQFPAGEGLGGFSRVDKSAFTFDSGETGVKVAWESDGSSGVTYLYAYTPKTEPGFAEEEQVVSLEVRSGNRDLFSQAESITKSLRVVQ